MSKETPKTDAISETDLPEATGVVAKLQKYKAEKVGNDDTTLPETGIKVTWPKFKPHGIWMKAVRLSKKNPLSVTDNYLPLLCKFDGERLTVDEFKELVPTDDILHLTGEVMGDEDDDEDGAGNVLH